MKRVINGFTYDTETATAVAQFDYDNGPEQGEAGSIKLYRTPGGAFFLHTLVTARTAGEATARVSNSTYQPLTREEAHDWVLSGNVELFSDVLGEIPEATEEPTPGVTLFVRLPVALKERIDLAGGSAGKSTNDWIVETLEERLARLA